MNSERIFTAEERHRILYINWEEEAIVVPLDKTAFNEKLKFCRENYKRIKTVASGGRTLRDNFRENGIFDEYVPKKTRLLQYRIYVRENDVFYIYKTARNGKDFKNNGVSAKKSVIDRFRVRTGLGRNAMELAFGTSPYEWRICTPKPLYFCAAKFLSTSKEQLNLIKNVGSIDGCSQYPTALSGSLPTTKNCKIFSGTIQPTEDYPFALYIKSGHLAIWGELDTHLWLKHRFASRLFDFKRPEISIDPDDDITVLMKKSEYNFQPEMEYFFQVKENYPKESIERAEAKLVMNAFIGMLHRKNRSCYNNFAYCHLSSFALARANQNLLKITDRIKLGNIIHICVDGVLYTGSEIYGTKVRQLGAFEQVFEGATVAIRSTNCYIVMKNEKVIEFKHGAYDYVSTSKKQIDEQPPTKFEDMFDWMKTDNSSEYDKIIEYQEVKL